LTFLFFVITSLSPAWNLLDSLLLSIQNHCFHSLSIFILSPQKSSITFHLPPLLHKGSQEGLKRKKIEQRELILSMMHTKYKGQEVSVYVRMCTDRYKLETSGGWMGLWGSRREVSDMGARHGCGDNSP
jgi:hypothetical protein